MAKVKKVTAGLGRMEKKRRMKMNKRKKAGVKGLGKSNRETRRFKKKVKETIKDAKCRPHQLHPGSKAVHEIRKYQKSTKLLIRKWSFQKLFRELAQEIPPNLRFQMGTSVHNTCKTHNNYAKRYAIGL